MGLNTIFPSKRVTDLGRRWVMAHVDV